MSAPRLAVVAAAAAVALWVAKGIAIAVAGGLDKSPLEGPLFALGMLSLLVALGAFGVAVTEGRPPLFRAGAAVAALVVGVATSLLVQVLVKGLLPASTDWVQEEAGLWVGSALIAVLITMSLRRRASAHAASA